MPRLPRYLLAGQPQHVIQRGNNRQPVFFEDADYWFFLECLQEGMRRWPCDLHAYVLMTNHVHLLLTPQAPDALSKLMQSVGRRYVQYINFAYARSGGLWEGRFRATPVNSDEYLLLCYRYIELNPVRAQMVDHPRRYRWSSYRYHAEGRPDPLVSDHPQFLALGNDAQERSMAYRALFTEDLDEATLERMRHSVCGRGHPSIIPLISVCGRGHPSIIPLISESAAILMAGNDQRMLSPKAQAERTPHERTTTFRP